MTDSELLEYATEFRKAIIGDANSARMCAAIAGPLSAALAVLGVPTRMVESDLGECNHIFLLLDDGRVLDPTADQFNWFSRQDLPGVYLGYGSVIHAGPTPWQHDTSWAPLLLAFKRLEPEFRAAIVGGMVRAVLASLPADVMQLPGCRTYRLT